MNEAELRRVLGNEWGVVPHQVSRLTGGMNSETWEVRDGSSRWAAKTVPARDLSSFEAGLRAAQCVEAGGVPAGEPVAARTGDFTVSVPTGWMALLTWVEGRPLDGADHELPVIGATLGKAHGLLGGVDVEGSPRFGSVHPDAAHLDCEAWVRPAVRSALRDWEKVRGQVRTWGLLHGDPSPEAFLEPPDGSACGLIDWSSCLHGPLLYDVASAVMYVGRENADEDLTDLANAQELVDAYLASSVLDRAEVEAGRGPMLGYRWAVQADYFARRLMENDLTGIRDTSENQNGLDDARRHLETR